MQIRNTQHAIEIKQTNVISKISAYQILENAYQVPPLAFSNISKLLDQIQALRFVEKLARPTNKQEKERLIETLNVLLCYLRQQMEQICSNSAQFREKDSAVIQGQQIVVSNWKHHILKIRNWLTNFYKISLRYFQKLRNMYSLKGKIQQIDQIEWCKQSMVRLKPFCFCG